MKKLKDLALPGDQKTKRKFVKERKERFLKKIVDVLNAQTPTKKVGMEK